MLENNTQEQIKLLEENFLFKFWPYIPPGIIKKEATSKDVSQKLSCLVAERNQPFISLDRIYFPLAERYLEATRITNKITGEVTIGERCGALPLEEQLDLLKPYKSIILGDVGSFEGTTLLKVCSLLEQKGLKIEELVLGFVGKVAQEKLSPKYKLSSLYTFEFYEWIELRDFFGIDGRRQFGTNNLMPYWNNLSSWASISLKDDKNVTSLCKEYNSKLLEVLEKGGYDIQRIDTRIKYMESEQNE